MTSPNPATAEAVLNPLALEALENNQRQLDMDGVEVGVSRQALDELLSAYKTAVARVNRATDAEIGGIHRTFASAAKPPASGVDAVAGGVDLVAAINHAESELSQHIEKYHDYEDDTPERASLRDIQHHLMGSLIADDGEFLSPAATSGSEAEPVAWTVESLAQWLHDEAGHQESYPHHHWPEHPDDDGNRDGGFVKIVPKHAQAYFRQLAARCLGIRPFSGKYFEAIGATPPAPAAVDGQRVKALVWNEYETEGEVDRWDAETALGTFYEISTQFDGYHVAHDCTHLAARFDTLDQAKAAAQADYEARIRACLATETKAQ